MSRFDDYIAVDWSASARPTTGADSIWLAHVTDPTQTEAKLMNPPTREEAMSRLVELLSDAVTDRRRVLVGVDAGFGYPAGTSARFGCATWEELWAILAEMIDDDATNGNNRFTAAAELNRRLGDEPGPFWGVPGSQVSDDLSPKKGRFPYPGADGGSCLDEYRRCERRLLAAGHRVQSVWKLFTTGSVGSQTLLAINRLQQLRRHPELGRHISIWPFEFGFDVLDRRPVIVVAEMWPAGFIGPSHWIRDAAQVDAAARRFADLDRTGQLDDLLLLSGVDDDDADVARREEGWILGAEDPTTIIN